MTINFSLICQLFSGSGQIRNAGTNYPSPGLAKIAPWWLAAGTPPAGGSAKVPHDTSAGCATNAYCPYQRAVINHYLQIPLGIHPKVLLIIRKVIKE